MLAVERAQHARAAGQEVCLVVLDVRCRVVEVLATMELAAALPLATTARRVDAVSVGEGDHRSLPLMLARCNRCCMY